MGALAASAEGTIQMEARAVAAAEHRESKATAALLAATKRRDKISARLSDLHAARVDIAARRARGDHHPDDAGRVALLDMDIAGLEELEREAESVRAAAVEVQTGALSEVATCRHRLHAAEQAAVATALLAYVQNLSSLTRDAAHQCGEAHGGLDRHALDAGIAEMGTVATSLGEALLSAVTQISAMAQQAGYVGRPAWAPTQVLADTLRRLQLQAGG